MEEVETIDSNQNEPTNEELELENDNARCKRYRGLRWIPTSVEDFEHAERRILKDCSTLVKTFFVPVWQGRCQIRVAVFEKHPLVSNKTPLVLVHGFAGGLGLWAQNVDALAANRTVYSIDLLGFGRSSRPKFSRDETSIELEWICSIEDFRRELNLDKMILLGHSLGGYLASAYALEYPDKVRHLVLVDPWGFSHKPTTEEWQNRFPAWKRAVAKVVTSINPLSTLRAVGPWGPKLVRRIRPDLGRRFTSDDGDESAIFEYIYHCNAQTPSGEIAFKRLTTSYVFAKRPMVERLPQLKSGLPVTFICGGQSWMDKSAVHDVREKLCKQSYVHVKIVAGAGHNVHGDQPHTFNELVNKVGDFVDCDKDMIIPHTK